VRRAVPQVRRAVPQVRRAVPQVRRAVPQVRRAVPRAHRAGRVGLHCEHGPCDCLDGDLHAAVLAYVCVCVCVGVYGRQASVASNNGQKQQWTRCTSDGRMG